MLQSTAQNNRQCVTKKTGLVSIKGPFGVFFYARHQHPVSAQLVPDLFGIYKSAHWHIGTSSNHFFTKFNAFS